MPKAKLTARTVENLKAPALGQVEYFDEALPGFALRITDRGRKSWVLFYRVKDGPEKGKQRRLTLGEYPLLSLGDGRAAAQEALRGVARGGDPAKEKQEAKRGSQSAASYTVDEVAAVFLEEYAKPRKKSWTNDERLLRAYVSPVWGKRPITSITPADADALIDRIAKHGVPSDSPKRKVTGAPVVANRVLSELKILFSWAAKKPRFQVSVSPVAQIQAPGRVNKRQRYLDDGEIRLFWLACEALGYPFGTWAQLVLLTCARRGMAAAMQWRDLDISGKIWRVPPELMKSGRELLIPLSGRALDIIENVPKLAGSEFVFPASRWIKTPDPSKRYIAGFAYAKRKLAAQMIEIAREEAADPEMSISIPHWTFHDLRRTATTHMGGLRVPRHIRKLILDHAEGDVTAIYDRHEYLDERREALELWAGKIERLITPAEANVVPLRG